MASVAHGLPEPVTAILLDAGGVLLELDYSYLQRLVEVRQPDVSIEALARAEALARGERNRAMAGEAGGADRGEPWRDYFHTLLHEVGLPGKEHEPIIDSLWEAHQKVGLWAMAIDDSLRVVDALRESGYRLAVVSNAEGQVARDLDNAGYHGRFETVVDSALVGVEKPDPRIFEIALARLKLEPDQVIYVGDVPAIDVVGARAAGITAVLVDPHDMYAGEDVPRIRRLAELSGLLAGD